MALMALMARNKIGVLKVEDPAHPATKMIGPSWPLVEEFYQFGTAAWDASTPTEQISQVGRQHIPMALSRDRVHVLLSRSFYTSLGHRDDIWSTDPVFRAHITGGIRWALGIEN